MPNATIARCGPDHPRVGGEHNRERTARAEDRGSSPRGRGTQPTDGPAVTAARIIPAWAGNTRSSCCAWSIRTDHPRVGGEHEVSWRPRLRYAGSSPRGRGTHTRCIPGKVQPRIIPAWAGNTQWLPERSQGITDHPRVGGEHVRETTWPEMLTGSSPRGRGTHHSCTVARFVSRIIPAWAGNTVTRPRR